MANFLKGFSLHSNTKKLLASFPSLTGERGDFIRTGRSDARLGQLDETEQSAGESAGPVAERTVL